MISGRIDTIILSLWMEEAVVGWYNVAFGLLGTLLFFSDMLNGALGPTLARTYASDKNTVNTIYQTVFRILFIFSIPLVVGTAILADKIILFLYTDEFAPAIPALQVMVWGLPLSSLSSLCSSIATAAHKEKYQVRIRIATAIVNVALNIYAIPRYGLEGAAVVAVLTELISFVLLFKLVNDQFTLQSVSRIIVKPLLAALLMGGVVLLGYNLNLFLIVCFGALVYASMLLATKAIDLRDPTSPESVLLRNVGQRLRRFADGSL
jgi:O-antigen/teichoic acid export membrane protein